MFCFCLQSNKYADSEQFLTHGFWCRLYSAYYAYAWTSNCYIYYSTLKAHVRWNVSKLTIPTYLQVELRGKRNFHYYAGSTLNLIYTIVLKLLI